MLKKFGFAVLALALMNLPALSFADQVGTNPQGSAQNSPLSSLNQAIAKLVAPLQDTNTQASLVFKKIKTDDVRALKLSLSGEFKKTGPANTIEFQLKHLRYNYGDGTHPTTKFKAFLGVDLTKILSQDDLHQMIPGLQQMLQEFVTDSYQQYGNAAKVTVKTYDLQQDAQGNYVSLKADISLHIDLTQLPASTPANEVLLTDARATFSVNLSQGVKLKGSVTSNPAYIGFQEDQAGLKQYLDLLLKQDSGTLEEIAEYFGLLNSVSTEVVNGNPTGLRP